MLLFHDLCFFVYYIRKNYGFLAWFYRNWTWNGENVLVGKQKLINLFFQYTPNIETPRQKSKPEFEVTFWEHHIISLAYMWVKRAAEISKQGRFRWIEDLRDSVIRILSNYSPQRPWKWWLLLHLSFFTLGFYHASAWQELQHQRLTRNFTGREPRWSCRACFRIAEKTCL